MIRACIADMILKLLINDGKDDNLVFLFLSILNFGIKAIAVQCDVSKEEDCEHLIKQAIVTFNRIDVLINNAGISMRALFKDLDLVVLKNLMDVNFWGGCLLYQTCNK